MFRRVQRWLFVHHSGELHSAACVCTVIWMCAGCVPAMRSTRSAHWHALHARVYDMGNNEGGSWREHDASGDSSMNCYFTSESSSLGLKL